MRVHHEDLHQGSQYQGGRGPATGQDRMQADATHEEACQASHQSPSPSNSDPPTRQEANTIKPAGICQMVTRNLGGGRGS